MRNVPFTLSPPMITSVEAWVKVKCPARCAVDPECECRGTHKGDIPICYTMRNVPFKLSLPSKPRQAKRLVFLLLSLASGAMLGGCERDATAQPPPDMNRQLPPTAFLGKWRLTKGSVALLVRDGFVPPAPAAPEAGAGLPASLREGLPP